MNETLDVVELRGVLGSRKRQGTWTVPSVVRVHQRLGSTELDLSAAVLPESGVRLELDVVGGSVEIRVPDGAEVDDQLSVTLGSSQDHRRAEQRGLDPRITVTGRLLGGSFEVRGPKRPLFGKR